MKSIFKIIIHVMKLVLKNFECFTSKPNANGTLWNLHIKINLKTTETNGSITYIEILYALYFQNLEYAVLKS